MSLLNDRFKDLSARKIIIPGNLEDITKESSLRYFFFLMNDEKI
tara:strand:- start:423 stop:554 length:132 start_codon:yes stop_codon:yes gene_type:complete